MTNPHALFRLRLTERDEAIVRKLMRDTKQTSLRKRLRHKIRQWSLYGGKEFLTNAEWNYLRSIYSDDL